MITQKLNASRAFTLIELMVVISIIALLSSIMLASIRPSTADAQDAARLEQTHSIGNALELYYLANGHYPIHTNSQNISIQNMLAADLSSYMSALPASFAIASETDYYISDSAGAGYELLVAKQSSTVAPATSNGALTTGSGCNISDYNSYSFVATNAYCQGVNVVAPLWNGGSSGGGTPPTVNISISPLGTLSQGQTPVTMTWSSSGAASCSLWDTTQLYGGYEGGSIGATSGSINTTVYTVSHGGDDQSGVLTMTCYVGSKLTGLSGSASVSVTIQQ